MNLMSASRRGWRAGCLFLTLTFYGLTGARAALAAPATRLDDAVVSLFVSTMLSNGRGTGFCVGDGSWVVTCYHVVSVHVGGDKDLPVTQVLVLSPWSGEPVKAHVVATDSKADLALLKLEHGQLPTLPVAAADDFQPEKLVNEKEPFTIAGYGQTAAQIESDPEIHTCTTPADLLAAAEKAERQVLLFAPTPGAGPGWSGGPVVNGHGQVVGVFRALVAQPQARDVWYPLATGAEPLRALLQTNGISLTPLAAPLSPRGSDSGAMFQREFRSLAWGLARHWDRAEKERRAELLMRPNDPIAHMGLSLALMWQDRLDEALKEADTAITLDPKRAGALFQKALVLQRMSRLTDAEEWMRHALEIDPDEAERRITLGTLLSTEHKTALAEAMLRRAVQLSPNHPIAHWRLGIELQTEGKTEEALAELRSAVRLAEPFPPLRVIQVDMAEALQKAGKPDEAEREWRELARTDDPLIQYEWASFLAERRKSPEALQAVEKCLSLLSQHPPAPGAPEAILLERANELKAKLSDKEG
jgi:tetratricopeptide (TPR) repeat protein